jgi:glycosyltransferase involved in cell wall biosynthesis
LSRKLLVVSHKYDIFVKDQVELLADLFDEIIVLVRYNPIAELARVFPLDYLSNFTKHSLINLRNKPSNVSVFPTPVFYAPGDNEYERLGDRHYRAVKKFIQQNNIQFDIIHSHFTWSAGFVGAKLKEDYRVPFFVTAHGFDIYDLPFKNKQWRENIRFVLNSADQVFTVSNHNLDCIRQLDIKSPVQIISNGFRSEIFFPMDPKECRNKLKIHSDERIILAVGNLEMVKGHTYLIDAVKIMRDAGENVTCKIIGNGQLKHTLQKQINNNQLGNTVKLVGAKPHSEIPVWINACDLFVLPSLKESFGIVQIEAMACGKPVIATHNGGSDEIILSDKIGILCNPADPAELAKAIILGLNKSWNGKGISEYAQQFDYQKIKSKYQSIFREYITF